MGRKKVKTKRISFTAIKKVTTPVKVELRTKAGELVTFNTTKQVTKPVKVTFHKRIRGKK